MVQHLRIVVHEPEQFDDVEDLSDDDDVEDLSDVEDVEDLDPAEIAVYDMYERFLLIKLSPTNDKVEEDCNAIWNIYIRCVQEDCRGDVRAIQTKLYALKDERCFKEFEHYWTDMIQCAMWGGSGG